jgi:hypothetical protein
MTGRAHGRNDAAYPVGTIGAMGCRAAAARTGRRIGSTKTTKASSTQERALSAQRSGQASSGRPGQDTIVIEASHAREQLTPAMLGVS